jgi:hypothetical protein
MESKTDYTTFYTEKFDKHIAEINNIIYLNIGDIFIDSNGNQYEIVSKKFNIQNKIMVYLGKLK